TDIQQRAYALDQRLDLRIDPSGVSLNWGDGKFDPAGVLRNGDYVRVDEQWLMSNDGWHFILPGGEVYKWDQLKYPTSAAGTLVEPLDSSYYQDLNKLVNAEAPIGPATGIVIDNSGQPATPIATTGSTQYTQLPADSAGQILQETGAISYRPTIIQ